MRRTEELIRADSCLNKAHDDEPIFVLRANDPLAPDLIRQWAERYVTLKRGVPERELTEREHAKYHEARVLANEMEAWRIARGSK